jgi:hypothetical protein
MDVKKQPVVIVFSILAALQVLNGGLALIDTIPKDVAAIISLVIGAVTAGASFYVRGMVTPWPQVVSSIQDGHVVAGPASGMGRTPPVDPPPEPPVGPKGF